MMEYGNGNSRFNIRPASSAKAITDNLMKFQHLITPKCMI